VRVNNHQIGFISTHRKIGHSPNIKWYQLSRLIGEFYRVLSFSLSVVHHPIVHQKSQKKIRLEPCPRNRLALHLHSISVGVELVC
jgi:hypothetical protein